MTSITFKKLRCDNPLGGSHPDQVTLYFNGIQAGNIVWQGTLNPPKETNFTKTKDLIHDSKAILLVSSNGKSLSIGPLSVLSSQTSLRFKNNLKGVDYTLSYTVSNVRTRTFKLKTDLEIETLSPILIKGQEEQIVLIKEQTFIKEETTKVEEQTILPDCDNATKKETTE